MIVEARELRIGNWAYIETNSSLDPLMIIEGYHLKQIAEGWTIAEAGELTEDWLLNFGFEKVRTYGYRKNWVIITASEIEGEEYCFLTACKFKYIHQLQNLYFALTGQELTLQLTSKSSES